MKKLFLLAILAFTISVYAEEVTTVTTNEYGQITKVVELTKNDTTKILVFIDRDFVVPLKYRAKWASMSEGEKLQVMMESNTLPKEVPVVYPKKVEVQVTCEAVIDKVTCVVRTRDEEEGE